MKIPILQTARCKLRPACMNDVDWMYALFNDDEVVRYIEGIRLFNSSKVDVRNFIAAMECNAEQGAGLLWCIEFGDHNIGVIFVYDLHEEPFLCFALFPEYRGLYLGKETITHVYKYISGISMNPSIQSINPIVKRISAYCL